MSQRFKRKIENFRCDNCGLDVRGDGYTNHCPRCLWSKHVDLHPGDRKSDCGGMMEAVEVSGKKDSYRILHRCQVCGMENWNRSAAQDDFETLLSVVRARQGLD